MHILNTITFSTQTAHTLTHGVMWFACTLLAREQQNQSNFPCCTLVEEEEIKLEATFFQISTDILLL